MLMINFVAAVSNHPTILVGTSTQPGTFRINREGNGCSHRTPNYFHCQTTKLAEATAADLIKWTDGKA